MKKIVIVDGGPRKNMNPAQLLQRLAFPWLSYNDYSLTAPKRMPVVLIETMNGTPERNNSNHFGTMEWCLTTALGEPERIIGYNTCQVAKYDNYELGSFSEEAKHAWRDAHCAHYARQYLYQRSAYQARLCASCCARHNRWPRDGWHC